MAQSYGVPSRECSVAEFDAQMQLGGDNIPRSWKGFCDCMFKSVDEVTSFRAGGWALVECVGDSCRFTSPAAQIKLGQFGPINLASKENIAQQVGKVCVADNVNYSLELSAREVITPNWVKCMSNFCGGPGGCPNPADPTVLMPFNINPGAAFAPWTDAGAGARGIPKKGAGLFYDITALTVIHMEDYDPLNMWRTFWLNPPLWTLLLAKMTLIPVIGLTYTLGMVVQGIPVFLIPGAIESAQRQGYADPYAEILNPIGPGMAKQFGFIMSYFGKCGVGINIPCGAGVIVQQAAQDQIDTGEINKVQSEAGRAIIYFLAKSGSQLVSSIINSVGDSWGSGIFAVMESGFGAVADNVPDANTKKIFKLLQLVAGVGQRIASGVVAKKPFLEIADDVAEFLLGFRPSVYFQLIKDGKKQSAVDGAAASMARTGNSVETMLERVNAISDMLNEFIKALQDLSNVIGGGLDAIIQTFGAAKAGISGASQAVIQVGLQIDSETRGVIGTTQGTATVKATREQMMSASVNSGWTTTAAVPPSTASFFSPISAAAAPPLLSVNTGVGKSSQIIPTVMPSGGSGQTTAVQPPAPSNVVPPQVVPPPVSGAGGMVAGAAVGFVLGGPAGAAVGLGLGLIVSKKG